MASLLAPLVAACAAFGCYIIANASWSADPAQAYGKALFYWIVVVLVCSAIVGLPQLSDRKLRQLQQAVVAAAIIGAGVLFFEVLSHGLIERVLFSNFTWLRPDPKHIQVVDGRVTAIGPYMLNRNMAALCLVIWPSLLMLRTLSGTQIARHVGVALLTVAAVAILWSDHATSVIAITLGA